MKIAVIGGGSSYTPELTDGLIDRARSLGLGELWLHDVDRARLETVAGFTSRLAQAKGSAVKVQATRDLERALDSASFVIAQIRVGGNAARREDERLGGRHGLVGQETTGVGGFAKALRTIPAMLEICGAMERTCPGAFLINFTNPSGLVTEALLKHTRTRAIGLCNIPVTFHVELARALGAERDEVAFDYVGLNHLSWVRRVWLRGEDVTARVLKWAGAAGRPANLEELDYPGGVIRALAAIPMHYLRYYYLTAKMLESQQGQSRTRADEVMEIEAELMKIYADPQSREKPALLAKRGGAHYSLAALELIESIHFDRKDVQVLDVMNGGAVAGLPADSVVEVRCRVGAEGAKPLPVDPPGPELLGLMRAVKAYEELAVKAAVERDYGAALLALLVHPLGPSADRVEEVLKDLMDTHQIHFDNQP